MGTKLKGTGVEFPDETLQTTAVEFQYYDSDVDLLAGGVAPTSFQINSNIETVADIASITPNANFSINATNWTGYYYQQANLLSYWGGRNHSETDTHNGSGGSSDWDDDPIRTYELSLDRYYYTQGTYTSINIPSHMVAGDTFRIMFDFKGVNTINYASYRKLYMYIISGHHLPSQATRSKTWDERYDAIPESSTIEGRYTIWGGGDVWFRNVISDAFTLTEDMVNQGYFYLVFENDPGYIFNPDFSQSNLQSNLAPISSKYSIDRIRFLEQDPSNTIDGDETTFWSGSTDGADDDFGDGIQYNIQNSEVVKAISISPDPDTKRIEVYGTNQPQEESGTTDGYTYDRYFSSGWDKIGDLTTDSASFPDSQIYDSKSLISGTSRYNYIWVIDDNSNSYQYYTVKLTSVNNTPVKIYEVRLYPKLLTSSYEYHLISNDSADGVVFTKSTGLSSIEGRVTALESRERYDVLFYTYYGYYLYNQRNDDIRTITTQSGETWTQILANINLCYPPSVYGVGKRLIFKPHQYYSAWTGHINATNQYMQEWCYILTRGTDSNGTPEWQLEHGGKATLVSTTEGEQVTWDLYDGD